jgi:squalene synthase HpnC
MALSSEARPTGSAGASTVVAPDSAMLELRRIADAGAAKISAENFPVALRALPRHVRDDLRRAYGFARFVDDVGDEAAGDRLALLDEIERDVRALEGGTPTLAPVRDLLPLLRQHGLALQPLLDLIEANRRDQRVTRYPTFDDLLEYCRLSAAPVGRIVLAIAHVDDPQAIQRSDQVCAALQVLEHCQDVGEDARAGRVYLPADDLRRAGVTHADLTAATTSPQLRRVVAMQVERADALFASGRPLVHRLHGWARVAVAGYLAGGQATAAALRAAEFDVLGAVIRPGRARTVVSATRLMARR